jgi:hypothetical protein
MNAKMRRRLIVASLLASLSGSRLAAADPVPPSPAGAAAGLSDTLQGPAKRAYESARLLASNHDYAGALTEFRQAYTLSKDPRLLFNMAICEKELRHYARMEAILEQFLRDAGSTASSESINNAKDAIAATKPLVATLRVNVNEPGATVLIDGEPVGTTPLPSPVSVDLGRHVILVKKAGFESVEQTVETAGGSDLPVTVTVIAPAHGSQLLVIADEGATVIIDSRAVAQGRFDGHLPAGAHQIQVTESGRVPYKAEVDLREGETRTVEVTLEAEHRRQIWPWIIGGAAVAAGAAVGGYFLFRPGDHVGAPPSGTLATVQTNAFGGR